jgi:hypothetical protein
MVGKGHHRIYIVGFAYHIVPPFVFNIVMENYLIVDNLPMKHGHFPWQTVGLA